MFDPARDDPFLLHPGDRVRFYPIDADAFDALASKSSAETPANLLAQGIRIVEPGVLTTVQDLGRPGLGRYGVAPGGALDRGALIAGNRLLGNEPGEAALEITLVGPVIDFTSEAIIALTGADLGARLNGAPVSLWRPVLVRSGDRLDYHPGNGIRGARQYLCVAGGLDVPIVMSSRSTDLMGSFGGLGGRAARAGDVIPFRGTNLDNMLLQRRSQSIPASTDPFRVVIGPQADRFTERGIAVFLDSEYRVNPQSNRTGVRLNGPAIEHRSGADIVSEGIALGAVQVPGDGQPIVLLAGRQTVGGYTKIATVIAADLDRFAQVRPGETVRFREVDAETAWGLDREARERPFEIEIAADSIGGSDEAMAGGEEWTPDGVTRVIETARRQGVRVFHLETGAIKLSIEFGNEPAATDTPPSVSDTIDAPMLGVFYRRSNPEEKPLAEVGDALAAGDAIGVIEVMKTFHEVRSLRAGVLAAFLAEDGQFVEYGQAVARIDPS
jgi:antagonist of KipI